MLTWRIDSERLRIGVCSVVLLLFSGCMIVGTCGERIILTAPSPNRQRTATVLERNCGATTDYSTLVFLTDSDQTSREDSSDMILSLSGVYPITLTWLSDTRLAVGFPDVESFTQRETWQDVQIEYPSRKGRIVETAP
jgi:hypothetical protein